MRILLDHCVTRALRSSLSGHHVRTAREMGWFELANGKLLAEAARSFDVMVTVDQNLEYQQNLQRLPLPVFVLMAEGRIRSQQLACASTLLNELQKPLQPSLMRIYPDGRTEKVIPSS